SWFSSDSNSRLSETPTLDGLSHIRPSFARGNAHRVVIAVQLGENQTSRFGRLGLAQSDDCRALQVLLRAIQGVTKDFDGVRRVPPPDLFVGEAQRAVGVLDFLPAGKRIIVRTLDIHRRFLAYARQRLHAGHRYFEVLRSGGGGA